MLKILIQQHWNFPWLSHTTFSSGIQINLISFSRTTLLGVTPEFGVPVSAFWLSHKLHVRRFIIAFCRLNASDEWTTCYIDCSFHCESGTTQMPDTSSSCQAFVHSSCIVQCSGFRVCVNILCSDWRSELVMRSNIVLYQVLQVVSTCCWWKCITQLVIIRWTAAILFME